MNVTLHGSTLVFSHEDSSRELHAMLRVLEGMPVFWVTWMKCTEPPGFGLESLHVEILPLSTSKLEDMAVLWVRGGVI